jgi:Xaa-Pro aminopeptidase
MEKNMNEREMARRIRAVRSEMRKKKLDGCLVLDRANTHYITNFPCSSSFILLTRDGAWFLTDFRYIQAAKQGIVGFEVQLQKEPKKDLARLVKREGLRRIGVESNLPYGLGLQYGEAFSPAKLVVDDAPLLNARSRKSRLEIDVLRESARRADAAWGELVLDIGEGWTEIEARNRLRRLIERHGGSNESFDSIVASGPNAAKPHAVPGDRKLARGDIAQVDTGMLYRRYCSDLSRVFSVGRPSGKMRRIHSIVVDAQRKAIDAVRAGAKASDIDAKARDYIARKGYGRNFGHGLGHGVGLEIHEAPRISHSSPDVLEPGMIITIEPGIYLPGWGGIRIEDVVVVRQDGCEILTTANKRIASV